MFVFVLFVILFSQSVYSVTRIESFGYWVMYTENRYDTYPLFDTFLYSTTDFIINGKIDDQQFVKLMINISLPHKKMFFAFQFVEPIGLTVDSPNVQVIKQFNEEVYAVRLTSVRFFDTLQQEQENNKNIKSNVKPYTDMYAVFYPELYNSAYIIMDERFINNLLLHKYCEIVITVGEKFIIFVIDTYRLKDGISQLLKLYSQKQKSI